MKNSQAEIIAFWFDEVKPQQWFQALPAFDAIVLERFSGDLALAEAGIFDGWMDHAEGCLALCLLLGQFPRHIYRGLAQAYAHDAKALFVASHGVDKRFDVLLPTAKRRFLYMPFVQAEDMASQQRGLKLFEGLKAADPVAFEQARRSHDMIARFGRFPARNAALGRISTPEEELYLRETP